MNNDRNEDEDGRYHQQQGQQQDSRLSLVHEVLQLGLEVNIIDRTL
jgi:hypothetical protein